MTETFFQTQQIMMTQTEERLNQKLEVLNERITRLTERVYRLEREKETAKLTHMGRVATAAFQIVEYCKAQMMDGQVLEASHQANIEAHVRKKIIDASKVV